MSKIIQDIVGAAHGTDLKNCNGYSAQCFRMHPLVLSGVISSYSSRSLCKGDIDASSRVNCHSKTGLKLVLLLRRDIGQHPGTWITVGGNSSIHSCHVMSLPH